MKKILLLACSFIAMQSADAQLQLSGSSYTQNFNNMPQGSPYMMPDGWKGFVGATSTTLGTDMTATKYYVGKTNTWKKTNGEFREVASANSSTDPGFDSTSQANSTDRALAVRQVGATNATFPNSDSGAAFALQIANPAGLTNFNLTFKLQSLDTSSPRVTAWSVDYGFGATPTTFTRIHATGDTITGGKTYKNSTVTVAFGTALNGQTGPIWIRIVALATTTGSGNRTTTAIDDYNLTWTGTAVPTTSVANVTNTISKLQILGNPVTGAINVAYELKQQGRVAMDIVDMSGRVVYSNVYNAASGAQVTTINDAHLPAGTYALRLNNEGREQGTVKFNVQ